MLRSIIYIFNFPEHNFHLTSCNNGLTIRKVNVENRGQTTNISFSSNRVLPPIFPCCFLIVTKPATFPQNGIGQLVIQYVCRAKIVDH